MTTQEFYNEDTIVDAILRDKPVMKDAELAHQLSSYRYKKRFNSDKFGEGVFRMF